MTYCPNTSVSQVKGDGIIDCLEDSEDELTCPSIACPDYCNCLGGFMWCTGPIVVEKFRHIVALKHSGLNNLKQSQFQHLIGSKWIMSLNLSHHGIKVLYHNHFRGLENLKSLDLSSGLLSKIDKGAFIDLVHLKDLNIKENRLTSINKKSFEGLLSLNVLDISSQTTARSSGNYTSQIELTDLNYLNEIDFAMFPTRSLASNLKIYIRVSHRLTTP